MIGRRGISALAGRRPFVAVLALDWRRRDRRQRQHHHAPPESIDPPSSSSRVRAMTRRGTSGRDHSTPPSTQSRPRGEAVTAGAPTAPWSCDGSIYIDDAGDDCVGGGGIGCERRVGVHGGEWEDGRQQRMMPT